MASRLDSFADEELNNRVSWWAKEILQQWKNDPKAAKARGVQEAELNGNVDSENNHHRREAHVASCGTVLHLLVR